MKHLRWLAIPACLVLVSTITPSLGAAEATTPAAVADLTSATTITLLTGDRITMLGSGAVSVQPGPGRRHIRFQTSEVRGRLRVVPSDAVPLLGAGRLDPRLFDLTALAEFGYDDHRPDLPLIMTHAAGAKPAATGRITGAGAKVVRELSGVDALVVRVKVTEREAFWSSLTGSRSTLAGGGPVTKVWLDGRRRVALDTSVPQIGAVTAWDAGFTGTGAKVAVIDTGVDDTHPDLAGQVTARANFTEEPAGDREGHGTHVASTIAGTGMGDGRHKGVAPGAKLLDAKVCDASGFCMDSAILAGMQWAVEQHADVVNMSLGGFDTPELDPLEAAVETLTAQHGTLFVVAAGNSGADRTINSPASADAALAVGAVSKTESLADFSSRGPRTGDSALKPDITAPGVDISAARASESTGNGQYVTKSGTSMATPHVAGAAAILSGQHPDWTGQQLKAALMGSARPNPDIRVHAQGSGRVDVARAISQSVLADQPSLSFGRQLWPHHDDTPLTKPIRYTNRSGAPVTLDLAVDQATGALFTVSPNRITVPAGGHADASVTVDTRVPGPDGFLGGYLTATGGGQVVSVAMMVEKEVESYDVTLRYTNREGSAAGEYSSLLLGLDEPFLDAVIELASDGQSSRTLRLTRGRWEVNSSISDGASGTLLIHPALEVTHDQTLEVDARLARRVKITPPRTDAALLMTEVVYRRQWADGTMTSGGFLGFESDIFTAQLGPDRTYDHVLAKVGGQWVARNAQGGTSASPYAYRLTWFSPGRVFTGFERTITDDRSLAAIRSDYRVHLPGATLQPASYAELPGQPIRAYLMTADIPVPFTQTEYVNTDGGIQWRRTMREWASDGTGAASLLSAPVRYTSGHRYHEVWNAGVFGPVLAADGMENPLRTGDLLWIPFELFGDAAGRRGVAAVNAHTALYRNGTLIQQDDFLAARYPVPPDPASYRLEAQAQRVHPDALSSQVSLAWTFQSGHVNPTEQVPLPVSVVRFTPALSADGSAPGGRPFTVPVTVQPNPGSTATAPSRLSIDVSYDDGANWQPARLIRHGSGGTLLLRHPAGPGFVSLRAHATDRAGNIVEQTIIRAYRITAG